MNISFDELKKRKEERESLAREGKTSLAEVLADIRQEWRAQRGCPDVETLAGYADRTLFQKDSRQGFEVCAHIQECTLCEHDVTEIQDAIETNPIPALFLRMVVNIRQLVDFAVAKASPEPRESLLVAASPDNPISESYKIVQENDSRLEILRDEENEWIISFRTRRPGDQIHVAISDVETHDKVIDKHFTLNRDEAESEDIWYFEMPLPKQMDLEHSYEFTVT